MSIKNYLLGLSRDIELLEKHGDIKAANILHDKFIRVATFPRHKDEIVDDSFMNADRHEEESRLRDQANEDYYGEYQDNPDEDIVDDSLASDFDLDTNEMSYDDDSNEEVYELINKLKEKLGSDSAALNLLKQLEDMYDSSAMGER